MEKLTIKELAPYMPYKMKFVIDMYEFTDGRCKPEIRHLTMGNDLSLCLNYGKPILRPLSDLTKEIEHDGEKFVFSDVYFSNSKIEKLKDKSLCLFGNPLNEIDYNSVQTLIKYYFDVFGLIEKGLAIDINTLNEGI